MNILFVGANNFAITQMILGIQKISRLPNRLFLFNIFHIRLTSLFVFQCSLKERHISALKRVGKRCQNGYVSSLRYKLRILLAFLNI